MSTTTKLLSIALAVGLLAGCGDKNVKPPKVVYVEVAVKEKIPEELLADCPVEEPTNARIDELLRVANARKLALLQCSKDKQALRKINE